MGRLSHRPSSIQVLVLPVNTAPAGSSHCNRRVVTARPCRRRPTAFAIRHGHISRARMRWESLVHNTTGGEKSQDILGKRRALHSGNVCVRCTSTSPLKEKKTNIVEAHARTPPRRRSVVDRSLGVLPRARQERAEGAARQLPRAWGTRQRMHKAPPSHRGAAAAASGQNKERKAPTRSRKKSESFS
jgi:hypothetical protein